MWLNKHDFDRLMNAYNKQSELVIKSHDREIRLLQQLCNLREELLELKSKHKEK